MNKQILNVIIEFFKKYPVYVVTTILFMFLIPVNDVLLSRLYGNMFQAVQTDTFKMSHFLKIIGVISFLQIGYAVRDLLDSKQIPFFQNHCKQIFLRKIFNDHDQDHTQILSGDLLSKIIRSQHIITAWYSKLATFIIPHVFELAFTTVYLFTIDTYVGVAFVLLLFVLGLVLFVSPKQSEKYTVKSDQALNAIIERIDDLLGNYFSVYKESKIENELKLLNAKSDEFIKYYMRSVYNALTYRLLLVACMIVFLYIFVSRTYNLMLNNTINKALFFSLIMMTTHLFGNIMWIIDVVRDAIFDYGSIKNSDFLRSDDDTKKKSTNELCVSKTPVNEEIILIENVFFKYDGQKDWILKDINLSFKRSEKMIVTGEIGSGKSTLLKLLLRVLKPSKGNIYINGKCYEEFSPKSFYKHISCIPQSCVLFNRSIIDNIRYDNPTVTKDDVIKVMKRFGIDKHFTNLKDGFDSVAGKYGNNLSGGQRQMVWFLKVFFKDPEIIFMDEPTASLDRATKELFWDITNRFFKDKTIVIVTHDDFLLQKDINIIRLKNGLIVKKKDE